MQFKYINFEPIRVPLHIKLILFLGILFTMPILILYSQSLEDIHSKNYNLFEKIEVFNLNWFKDNSNEAKKCLTAEKATANLDLFDDVMESNLKPSPDTTIFFHDTSCSGDVQIAFTTRGACALESVAKSNPMRKIFVLFSSATGFTPANHSSPIVKALRYYRNVQFRNVNWHKYAKDTPIEDWANEGLIFSSKHFQAHLSDFLRLITLYRFGGVYFDLDFIFHKKMDDLPPNFISEQSANHVSNAAFGFQSIGVGHDIVDMLLRESMKNYDPNCQSCSGWETVKRVLEELCNQTHSDRTDISKCQGLKMLPHEEFFPVQNWKELLSANATVIEQALASINSSIGFHIWNRFASAEKIAKSAQPKSALHVMAEKYCPRVFEASGEQF